MEEQYRQTMELKCFNCIHAPLCMAQKGGVNLGLASENDCCYFLPKLPDNAIVITKEEYDELTYPAMLEKSELIKENDDLRDKCGYWADLCYKTTKELKQSRKDAITEFVAKLKNKTTTKVNEAQFTFTITHEMLDKTLEECGI